MKALIILTILLTLTAVFLQYKKNKDMKKLLITLGSFILIFSLATIGNLTRQVFPLFIGHIVLILIAWGAVIFYMLKDKYYWWIIFSPIITIGLFLLLELIGGSGHELG